MDLQRMKDKIENLSEGGAPSAGQSSVQAPSVEASPEEVASIPLAPDLAPEQASVCEVWIVRHGERYDEVRGNDWMAQCGAVREGEQPAWWDPPLTARGKTQAERSAAELLATMTISHSVKVGCAPFDSVFCSPLQRCVSTAEPFSAYFGIPIQTVPGIAECCAALRGKMSSSMAWQRNAMSRALQTQEQLAALCPEATFVAADPTVESYLGAGGNESCPGRLAHGKARILIVTHREGIRDLTQIAGNRTWKTPYCCIAKFTYQTDTHDWDFHGLLQSKKLVLP